MITAPWVIAIPASRGQSLYRVHKFTLLMKLTLCWPLHSWMYSALFGVWEKWKDPAKRKHKHKPPWRRSPESHNIFGGLTLMSVFNLKLVTVGNLFYFLFFFWQWIENQYLSQICPINIHQRLQPAGIQVSMSIRNWRGNRQPRVWLILQLRFLC